MLWAGGVFEWGKNGSIYWTRGSRFYFIFPFPPPITLRVCFFSKIVIPKGEKRGRMQLLTHSWVLLGAIGDDFDMVSIHVVAEEVIEVRLWPLASKHVQVSVSLFHRKWSLGTLVNLQHISFAHLAKIISDRSHSVEKHAMSNARLHVLWPGITRVLAQESPRSCLTVVGIQPTELWLRRPTVLHTAVAG